MANLGIDDPAMTYDATQKIYQGEAPLWIDLVRG